MDKRYRSWEPRQSFLLPPSLLDWLPEGHLAYFILDLLGQLDLSEIEDPIQDKDPRGTRPHNPFMMTALLLYAYCVGLPSSRKIERATFCDLPFRVIAGGTHPDHTVISEFRRINLVALSRLFLQILQLCQKAGLVKLGHVALDGTKMAANASKHKAMSYDRMLKKEEQLKADIARMWERAETADQEEDDRLGPGGKEEDLPEELRRRESRLQKIQEALAALEADAARTRTLELQELAEQAQERAQTAEAEKREAAQRRAEQAAKKAEEAARKAKEKAASRTEQAQRKAEQAAEKAQSRKERLAARAAERNLAAALRDQQKAEALGNRLPQSGNGFPENRVPAMVDNCGQLPERLSADTGYWSEGNAAAAASAGIDAYIALGRQKHGTEGAIPEETPAGGSEAKQRMQDKLKSDEGKKIYARRKVIAEPPFGQIKEAQGFRRFWQRGTERVKAEWGLICLSHNLLKLFRFGPSPALG